MDLFDLLAEKWSYKSNTGMPDLNDLKPLVALLEEYGINPLEIERLVNRLNEEDDNESVEDDKYEHEGGGVYTRKGEKGKDGAKKFKKDDSGRYQSISDEEAKEMQSKGQEDQPGDNGNGGEQGPALGSEEDLEQKGMTSDDYLLPQEKEPEEPQGQKPQPRVIDGKDKSLKQGINPAESEFYNEGIEPTDESFDMANREYENITPPPKFKLDPQFVENAKVPKKYFNVLERMINTKATDKTSGLGHFISDGGAGQISAQAGELMTMMSTTMSDEEWGKLSNSILAHEQAILEEDRRRMDAGERPMYHKIDKKGRVKDNPGSRIVDKSWVNAATNNRQAILDRINKNHPGAVITAGGWDTERDYEAMGGSNYTQNKGFSTDTYFRVKTQDGQEILDEVSLKKSKKVNFLNSGTGEFLKWDPDVKGSNIDPQVYMANERKGLAETVRNIYSDDELQKDPTLKSALESTEQTTIHGKRGANRKNSKTLLKAIQSKASDGDAGAEMYLEQVDRNHTELRAESINAIIKNKKLKEGLMNSIREEFPLRAVSTGEETMAIGDMSFDPDTMREIFGTSDYDKIKEKLVALEDDKGEPYLGYRADVEGEVIPLSNIVIRQDGVGYGGSSIKFEMKLHPAMAKRLDAATKKVYGR